MTATVAANAPSPTPPPADSSSTWQSVAIVLGFLVIATIGIAFLIRAGMRQGDRDRLERDPDD